VDLDLQVALVAGFFALISTLLSIRNEIKSRKVTVEVESLRLAEQRRFDRERAVAPYREPLARAAYDLQSRIYNILRQRLIDVYLTEGNNREQQYVVENTVFLIAQYFAWTEIVRKHIQLLDLGADEQTRRLAHLQDDVHGVFLTDRWGSLLRVFAGEQRAIGEKMIRVEGGVSECLGYAGFLEADFGKVTSLLDYLRTDVRAMTTRLHEATPRLVALQHAMIDLLSFLDPEFIRFPASRRTKVSATHAPAAT
jgi:hypothetical protein